VIITAELERPGMLIFLHDSYAFQTSTTAYLKFQ